ncbi:prepilin peptidase [Maritimibacter alkaliphilus]|uniref:prepilin peptidase n=1 Tax=Maritimibacter alkaliphilus TaxID=404236 RepID=UPI001C940821|nr:A24 family peptidase [Maritimibacter alkaliphilus]MBY6092513.1 prepilin peptidase [Maritimibacter alkaliphilus]
MLLGPFIGSFLGVLVDRLPRGENIVAARSACRSCGTRLSGRDMVPLLSYALLRGRCRHCGATLPAGLLYIEILATGAGLLACAAGGAPVAVWFATLLLWLLLTLAACDLRWLRLPDLLTAALMLLTGAAALFHVPGTPSPVSALIGGLAGVGSFALLRFAYRQLRGVEGLGLGDVKLMAGLGAYAGIADLPLVVLLAALGALSSAMVGAVLHPRGHRKASLAASRPLPFGAALCGAAALLWLLRAAGLPIP